MFGPYSAVKLMLMPAAAFCPANFSIAFHPVNFRPWGCVGMWGRAGMWGSTGVGDCPRWHRFLFFVIGMMLAAGFLFFIPSFFGKSRPDQKKGCQNHCPKNQNIPCHYRAPSLKAPP